MTSTITPRMAQAGTQKLVDLGYEGVEFTDAQVVFRAMVEASPLYRNAPALLEALSDLLIAYEGSDRFTRDAQEVIAKAEGRS